jgi:hypothetical protein
MIFIKCSLLSNLVPLRLLREELLIVAGGRHLRRLGDDLCYASSVKSLEEAMKIEPWVDVLRAG